MKKNLIIAFIIISTALLVFVYFKNISLTFKQVLFPKKEIVSKKKSVAIILGDDNIEEPENQNNFSAKQNSKSTGKINKTNNLKTTTINYREEKTLALSIRLFNSLINKTGRIILKKFK